MKAAAFDYYQARDVDDAIAMLVQHGGNARPLAGGCSLGPMLNLRLARPSALIDLRGLPELRQLSQTANSLIIGACLTHAEIEDGVVADPTCGFMRQVASNIAFRPIRNRGTIGGSLAHADPAADWMTALAALDATVLLRGSSGQRRAPVASFITGAYATALADDELVVAIDVPTLSDAARWSFEKICRKKGDFALAIVAAVVDPQRDYARIACGAVGGAPLVLEHASAALRCRAANALAVAPSEIAARLSGADRALQGLHAVAIERAIQRLTT